MARRPRKISQLYLFAFIDPNPLPAGLVPLNKLGSGNVAFFSIKRKDDVFTWVQLTQTELPAPVSAPLLINVTPLASSLIRDASHLSIENGPVVPVDLRSADTNPFPCSTTR
jgi:hypothetical protein